jgi:hypothetical protein
MESEYCFGTKAMLGHVAQLPVLFCYFIIKPPAMGEKVQ